MKIERILREGIRAIRLGLEVLKNYMDCRRIEN